MKHMLGLLLLAAIFSEASFACDLYFNDFTARLSEENKSKLQDILSPKGYELKTTEAEISEGGFIADLNDVDLIHDSSAKEEIGGCFANNIWFYCSTMKSVDEFSSTNLSGHVRLMKVSSEGKENVEMIEVEKKNLKKDNYQFEALSYIANRLATCQ
jgi:hypothetical protein